MAAGPPGQQATALRRSIGPVALVFFIVGDILGAGIYALTGRVADKVGGAAWLPFLLAFCLAALTAASYAELVGRYPRAAGAALYVNRAFHTPFLTFMIAFTVLMSGVTSAAAAARAFGGNYLAEFITVPVALAALGFLGLITAVNLIGISESIKVNIILTVVEATGLFVIIAIGGYALATGEGEPSRALELDTSGTAWFAILGGTALAFYALLGFEDSVNLAEECRNPRRDFPRALFLGLAVTGTVYLAVVFTSTMLVSPAVLAESSGPLLEVVKVAGLEFPPKLFALIALLAVGNTALINMLMASRLVYGMASEGIVPAALGRVGGRQTPYVAIAATVGLAASLVLTGDLSALAETTVFLILLVFAAVNISVLVLRRTAVEHDSYQAPTWVPWLGAVTCLALASPLADRPGTVYLRAALLLGLGTLIWVGNRWHMRRSRPPGEEVEAL